MFLRPNYRPKDGKEHAYWSLVETVRTPNGPRQRTVCYLGELNHSAQARWHKTIAVFNEQGERRQLKLFPADAEAPENDPQVARVLVDRVRFDRVRQFGNCFLGLELCKRLELDQFLVARLDPEATEVPGSRVGAVSSGKASRNCCTIQGLVGCSVALKWRTFQRIGNNLGTMGPK